MSEPVYKFVKGEGWVVSREPDCPHVYFEHSGKRFVLEDRFPGPGERFLNVFNTDRSVRYLTELAKAISSMGLFPTSYYLYPEDRTNQPVVYREV